jgi:superfamily II DNA or RNA helicase
MGLLAAYDDRELARVFGTSTLERGQAYVDADRVLSVEVNDTSSRLAMVEGQVQGTRSVPYSPTVTLAHSAHGAWLDARCSCPVARLCKHAVALMIVARDREDPAYNDPGWQHRLTLLLDELDDEAEHLSAPRIPLALQVELPPRVAPRWSEHRQRETPLPGQLRIRPLRRGKGDNWVKTGVSWHQLSHLGQLGSYDEAQTGALVELLQAHRTATRQMYSSADSHLTLASVGPTLWSVLATVQETGVALVPAGVLRELHVLPDPVTLRLDVNGADGPRAHLRLGVEVPAGEGSEDGPTWFPGERIEVLGESGHGVALWTRVGELWDVHLARLTRPAGLQTRRILATGQTLPVPVDEVEALVEDYLPRLQRHLPVVSTDRSVRVPESPEPRLALTVTWKAVDEVHVAWSWRYRVGSDDRIYALGESRGLRGLRKPASEAAVLDGLELSDEQVHRFCGGHRREQGLLPSQVFLGVTAMAFTEDALAPLEQSGQVEIEEIGTRPDYQELTGTPVIRFVPRVPGGGQVDGAEDVPVEARTDWLDLEVIVTVGDHQVGLASLLEAMTHGAERMILRNGRHLRIDRPEFAELRELVLAARELHDETGEDGDGVRVSRGDLGLWAELAEVGIVDAQAAQWARDWLEAARALVDLDSLPAVEPTGVDATLRHYQLDGFRWLAFLWERHLGGILADDMGLGKTLQTLALVAHARARGAAPFLVVAPTSVVSTWAQEAATFTGLDVRTVTESRARRGTSLADAVAGADVVVTSYTLYRLEVDDYVALDWGGLVLDEAQTVKNHQGKTYQGIRRLEAPFRLALTGTPMENRLMELWSLLSIVAPGLYPYPAKFAELVANPVEKEGDAQVLERFRRRIRPFLLRRTKDVVAADLPPKQEQVLEVRLTPAHRRIYQTHLQRERQNVLGLLGDFDRQRIAIFRSLTRLRQLSLDAALVDDEYAGVGSAKTDVLVDHLLEILAEGHRALVFSQFTSFLTRVRSRLEDEGISTHYLDGRTRRRSEVIEGFKRGDSGVFLISLKAGGVGLTLTEADYVFVLDPWWNPAVEAQAVDRAHRIGQRKPVIVYRLVSADTIEEKVMELKARKAALFAKVLDGDGGMGTPIDADDVAALLAD